MSRKNINQFKVVEGESLSADFTSAATTVKYLDNISYQINVQTTDSVGYFVVQGSSDFSANEPGTQILNPGNWVDLTLGGGTPAVSMADDTIVISLNQVPFSALRVKYVSTTPGTGTCDMYIMSKQLGG